MLLEQRKTFCNNKQIHTQIKYSNYKQSSKVHDTPTERIKRKNRHFKNNSWGL